MSHIERRGAGPLCICILLVSSLCPGVLRASHTIRLGQDEARLVEKGRIVLREVGAQAADGRTFEAVATVQATYQQTFEVLTDFGKYHEFMPNVSTVEVLEKNAETAVVNFVLVLALGKTKRYRLKLQFSEDEDGARISWRMVDWPGLEPEEAIRDTSGYWLLTPYAGNPNSTLALYHVFTDPGEVPFGMEWIVELLSEKSLPKTIKQTRKRVAEIYD